MSLNGHSQRDVTDSADRTVPPELLELDASELRELLVHSRKQVIELEAELQTTTNGPSKSSSPPSSTVRHHGLGLGLPNNHHLPSLQHAYDLKSLAEDPSDPSTPEISLNEDPVHPLPNPTITIPSTDPDDMETLEPETPAPARKKRPASILGLKRIPSSIVSTTASLHSAISPLPLSSPSGSRNLTSPIPSRTASPQPPSPSNPNGPSASSSTLSMPAGPKRRPSGTTMGTTKVIEELQGEMGGIKAQLERTRNDLRLAQRLIGQLTRQNEDLRETKERMRAEIEGVNKQMDRKQKLLTEVLERARTAESAVQTHLKDRKALETSTSKALNEMSTKLQEAQTVSTKSEREAVSLREGFQAFKEMQKKEVAEVKAEFRVLAERSKADLDEATAKRNQLTKAVQARTTSANQIEELARESRALQLQCQEHLEREIEQLRRDLQQDPSTLALQMAESLTEEFARMKRLVRSEMPLES